MPGATNQSRSVELRIKYKGRMGTCRRRSTDAEDKRFLPVDALSICTVSRDWVRLSDAGLHKRCAHGDSGEPEALSCESAVWRVLCTAALC